MKKPLRVGVLGASGLVGVQLVSMLHSHPAVSEVIPFSRRSRGKPFGGVFPAFHHLRGLTFREPEQAPRAGCDVVFLALPSGESFAHVEALEPTGATLIDASGDFRIKDPALYESIYGRPHASPGRLSDFVVVVPEINGACLASGTRFVSTAGCTATAVILALHPMLANGHLASPAIIVDAKTSSTGAGSRSGTEAQSHHYRAQGVRVHRLLEQHRHRHEIASFLETSTGARPQVFLNTFAVDLVRGLSCAVYVDLQPGVDARALHRAYRAAYGDHRCIRIIRLQDGFDRFPNPKASAGTGFCDIGFHVHDETRKAVLIVALDNLMKGGASQAVQCFNRLVGEDDTTGVPLGGHFP